MEKTVTLALVNPPQRWIVNPSVYPPVGLGYLVAAVHKWAPWVDVTLHDLQGASQAEAEKTLRGYDIVGYSVTTPYWDDTVALARALKPHGRMQIVGGAHVTITREHNPIFNVMFLGPAERSLCDFLRDYGWGEWQSLYVSRHVPLDDLPYPECGLGKKLNRDGAKATAVVYTSRGCMYRCTFCAARAMYPKLEFRSIENVVGELKQLVDRGVTEIRFMDDSFTCDYKRTYALCRALRDLGLHWAAMVRPDELPEDVATVMAEAGCRGVALGVESFDDSVLRAARKGHTAAQNEEAIRTAAKVGLNAHLFMLMGTSGERYRITPDLNIAALDRLPFQRMLFSSFMPHPGTPVEADPEAHGVTIVDRDYSRYNQHPYVRTPEGVKQVPLWSPIRIHGMTEEQQMENLSRMRDYCCALPQVNKGVLK